MKQVFADSFYFIATLNKTDAAHDRALQYARQSTGHLVTTRWVLAEVADALCSPVFRDAVGAFVERAFSIPSTTIAEDSESLFDRGLTLYRCRPDKEWSLTDCISFVVMSDKKLAEALTNDHHFEQAGFVALLK